MPPATTAERRKTLRKLLMAGRGGTQEELRELLAERGFKTTQSTVSRDLKLLGAERRIRDDGSFVYGLVPGGLSRFPADMVLSVEHNESMIVVRTKVGRAPAVGIEVDGLRHPDVLGCISGDDTVLVVPRSVGRIPALANALREVAELM